MANDFLSSLFAQKQAQVENSPLMTEEERLLREQKQASLQEDPEDSMPAIDEEPSRPGPLMSKAESDLIKTYPKAQAEQDVEKAPVDDVEQIDQAIAKASEGPRKYQELLDAYASLKPKQQDYEKNLGNITMLQGANQIAQGMARGYGADIGSGEVGINALKAQYEEPLNAVKRQMAVGKEAMSLDEEMSMQDPKSDISEFYRQQAYTLLKRLQPNSDYTGKLDNMSASQLQKLPGMKNVGTTPSAAWVATDRVDAQGNPVRFNKLTGEYSTADGSTIKPGDYTARDILRRDPLTGNYAIGNAGNGMKILPTSYGSGVDLTVTGKDGKAEKPREVTYGEFAKGAPELAKKFDKIQDSFNKDMRDSREVATSVTNLASKLKPGANGQVDSGLLGGIQTQAAKMAGQKGVLTDQDLVKFAGAGGVAAKLERLVDNLQGDMSESDIKFFKRFAELMGKSLNQDILNRSELYTEQARQMIDTTVPGVTSQNVAKMLGVDKVAPVVQNEGLTSKDKDLVSIQGPSGQIAKMTKENAKKYLAKPGYKEVK